MFRRPTSIPFDVSAFSTINSVLSLHFKGFIITNVNGDVFLF